MDPNLARAIPNKLVRDVASGRCVLWVGSGLSKHGQALPVWSQFIEQMVDAIPHDRANNELTPEGAKEYFLEYLEYAQGRFPAEYDRELKRILRPDGGTPRAHKLISSLPWRAVITTNLDQSLEQAFEEAEKDPIVVKCQDDIAKIAEASGTLILKMHGDVDGPERVLTLGEYQNFRRSRDALNALLLAYISNHPVLILGAGLKDPNFLELYGIVHHSFGGFQHPAYYVGAGVPQFVKHVWRSRKFSFLEVPHLQTTEWIQCLAKLVTDHRRRTQRRLPSARMNSWLKERSLVSLGDHLKDYGQLQRQYTRDVQIPDYGWFTSDWDESLYRPLRKGLSDSIQLLFGRHQACVRMLYCGPGPHAPAVAGLRDNTYEKLARISFRDIDGDVLRAATGSLQRKRGPETDCLRTDFSAGLGGLLSEACAELLSVIVNSSRTEAEVRSLVDGFGSQFKRTLAEFKPQHDDNAWKEGVYDLVYSEMVASFMGTPVLMAFRTQLYQAFSGITDAAADVMLHHIMERMTQTWQEFNDIAYTIHLTQLARATRDGGLVLVAVDTEKIFDGPEPDVQTFTELEPPVPPSGIGLVRDYDLTTTGLEWRDHAYGFDLRVAGRNIADFHEHKHRVALYAFKKRLP